VLRTDVRPILKWAGGKWRLMPALERHFPPLDRVHRYFEPFVGGAAVFFHLQHPCSFLSDSNDELINVYAVVRDHLDELVLALNKHVSEAEHYYRMRAWDTALLSPVDRAARLIYLNKTCYNGLYRVNSAGQFNVPFGRYRNPTICDAPNLRAASRALRHATLRVADHEAALDGASAGDFVYFDPPYQPISKTASFTSYTHARFDAAEQERLARTYTRLHRAGCYLVLSNSDTPLIRDLYAGFRVETVSANRAINCKAGGRGRVSELVIVNYTPDGTLI
jgi:DNA adenine methylase